MGLADRARTVALRRMMAAMNPFRIIRSWFADPEYVRTVLVSTLGAAVFLTLVYGLGGLR